MGMGILSSLGRLSSFGGSCLCACAASVTVVGSVCECLLSQISHTERLFVLKTMSPTLSGQRRYIFVAICLKQLRSIMQRNMTKTKANGYANYSGLPAVSFLLLTHSEAPEVTL